MLKKILSFFLAAIILTVATGTSVFAQTDNNFAAKTAAKKEKRAEDSDLKSLIKTQDNHSALNISNKSTLADYQKAQKQGKGFSTTTKVLIGVGIAAAVVGIVIFAASRDKIRTF